MKQENIFPSSITIQANLFSNKMFLLDLNVHELCIEHSERQLRWHLLDWKNLIQKNEFCLLQMK